MVRKCTPVRLITSSSPADGANFPPSQCYVTSAGLTKDTCATGPPNYLPHRPLSANFPRIFTGFLWILIKFVFTAFFNVYSLLLNECGKDCNPPLTKIKHATRSVFFKDGGATCNFFQSFIFLMWGEEKAKADPSSSVIPKVKVIWLTFVSSSALRTSLCCAKLYIVKTRVNERRKTCNKKCESSVSLAGVRWPDSSMSLANVVWDIARWRNQSLGWPPPDERHPM